MDRLCLFLLDQGIPDEYELDKFNMPHTGTTLSPPKLAMSTAMPNPAPTPSDCFTSGQNFLETFTLLPETTRNTNSRWLQRLFPQTANIISRTSNDMCCFLHSLITPFHLFTSFLSYKACSTNVNSIFHAAIKNYHKNISTSYFSLSLSFINNNN